MSTAGLNRRSLSTSSWMATAFVIALALAAIAFANLGAGDQGTFVALRLTARWSFLLFWFAYAGGAITKLSGLRLGGLERRGREFGLAFASAQLVHVGLVLWLFNILTGPVDAMVFFWVGVLCTYLLAIFSLPRLSSRAADSGVACPSRQAPSYCFAASDGSDAGMDDVGRSGGTMVVSVMFRSGIIVSY